MKPDKALSNTAYVDHVINKKILRFDRLTTDNKAKPLSIEGKDLLISLKGKDRTESRENHGGKYIENEVAILLLKEDIFHFHSRILIKNISQQIFEDIIAIYVRP